MAQSRDSIGRFASGGGGGGGRSGGGGGGGGGGGKSGPSSSSDDSGFAQRLMARADARKEQESARLNSDIAALKASAEVQNRGQKSRDTVSRGSRGSGYKT